MTTQLPECDPFESLISECSLQYLQDLSHRLAICFSFLEHLLEYQVLPWFIQDPYSYWDKFPIQPKVKIHTFSKPCDENGPQCRATSNSLLLI